MLKCAASRETLNLGQIDKVTTAIDLIDRRKEQLSTDQRSAVHVRAETRPRRYKTNLQKTLHCDARRDAEASGRTRWLQALAALIIHSPTPVGQLLNSRRTWKFRGVQKFIHLVRSNRALGWPSSVAQLPPFLGRHAEPAQRQLYGMLMEVWEFHEFTRGHHVMSESPRRQYTRTVYKELLSNAAPGQSLKQAKRTLVSMISALERLAVHSQHPSICACVADGCSCTLRFSDRRGIKLSSARASGSSFTATLTWSKTMGSGKAVDSRPLVIHACCFIPQGGTCCQRQHRSRDDHVRGNRHDSNFKTVSG